MAVKRALATVIDARYADDPQMLTWDLEWARAHYGAHRLNPTNSTCTTVLRTCAYVCDRTERQDYLPLYRLCTVM